MKNNAKAHLALLFANSIYGANYIIAKGIMPNKISATAIVFFRLSICTLLFWLLKLYLIKEKIAPKDLWRLALCGLLGAALNQLLFFQGISMTSPIDAAIIQTSTPIIVLIFSYFILNEGITFNKLLGITIGGLGALCLILYGKKAIGTSSFIGNLYVFLNTCSFGAYMVVVKPLLKKYHPITVISWVFLFGAIYVLPFSFNQVMQTNFNNFTLHTYLVLIFIVLFTTFLAYLLNIYAYKFVSPTISSTYIYLQPAVSFLMVSCLAYIAVNDVYANDINPVKIISCIMVAIGVYIVSKPEKNAI